MEFEIIVSITCLAMASSWELEARLWFGLTPCTWLTSTEKLGSHDTYREPKTDNLLLLNSKWSFIILAIWFNDFFSKCLIPNIPLYFYNIQLVFMLIHPNLQSKTRLSNIGNVAALTENNCFLSLIKSTNWIWFRENKSKKIKKNFSYNSNGNKYLFV